ncbi:hypothetical protein ASE61_25695 [Bosea sp. Root670]|uniref:hypothetical protein n=1 Tax=Bosea sp. Root670 TaxID=1736583 RepID=UPI00071345B4|nr:hypothetical protein [Bosea sp. Root670]KRE04325.1 hypothetical protein ASE61_25695 [Bosea sp. Root670]
MKPSVEAYTVALPWYERDDFQRLWELAHDRDEMPSDYDVWLAAALSVMNAWLARGRALQIVTIRPEEFLAWLEAAGLPNTAATRLKYVECKAASAGSETSGLGISADPSALTGSKT